MDIHDAGWIADGLERIPGLEFLAQQIRDIYDACTTPLANSQHFYDLRNTLNGIADEIHTHLTQYQPQRLEFQHLHRGLVANDYHSHAEILATGLQGTHETLVQLAGKMGQAGDQANSLQIQLDFMIAEVIVALGAAAALIPTLGLDAGAVFVTIGGLAITAGTYTAGVLTLAGVIIGALALTDVITTNPSIEKAIEDAIKALEQVDVAPNNNTDPNKGTDPDTKVDPFPIPLDPKAPPRTKDEQCSPQDWATFVALFGPSYVGRIKDEHPIYGCFILKELRDINTQKPGLLGGLPFIQANMLLGGADSNAKSTDANNGTGESTLFQGSFFQLQWIHDHLNSVSDVELVGNDAVQGPDAELVNGTFVDFKNLKRDSMNVDDLKAQVAHFQSAFPTTPPHPVHFVFNATKANDGLPPRILAWLNDPATKAQGITYELATPQISD